MAYARASGEHELVRLRDEITNEVNADAAHLATSVFGEAAKQPDVARVSDEQLEQVYRRAYARQDRSWLQGEARRDPEQFLRIAGRLGVRLPGAAPAESALPAAPVPASPPPMALPAAPAPLPAPAAQVPLPAPPPVPAQPAPPTVAPGPGF